jgi:LysR family glycine cleavage system transcriptional activator
VSDAETTGGRRLPPLNALKAFEATARRLNVSQAARDLGVTPGAVSQQIRILEDHAGAPLFRREGGKMALTDLGLLLEPILRDAFEQLSRAAEVIYGPSGRRSLSISVPPSFAVKWLVPRMASFSAEHPGIEVWISADMQLANVAGGRVDVAVRYGRGDYPGVRSETLLDAGVIPVCSPALLSGEDPLRRADHLARHTLIHVRRSAIEEPRPDWTVWLASRGLSWIDAEAGPRFDQTALAIDAAIYGRGVTLAPRAFVAADLAYGRLVAPFADGYLASELAYHVLTRRQGSRAEARVFTDWIRHQAQMDSRIIDEL